MLIENGRRVNAENTRAYMGGLVSFLIKADETEDRYSLVEAHIKPGSEPPLHYHQERDVVFYVLEGEMYVYRGSDVFKSLAGDSVLVPRGWPHTYRVLSPTVRFLALMQPSKGIDGWFLSLSQPASNVRFPVETTSTAPPDPAAVSALAERHGLKFLTQAEASELLPHYEAAATLLQHENQS